MLAGVDQVLVPSAALRDVVVANGLAPERVEVDENDVDPAIAETTPPSSGAGPSGDVRFVYVGGDHPLKGRDVMLAAARRLRRRPGWRLTMYGVARPSGVRPWR